MRPAHDPTPAATPRVDVIRGRHRRPGPARHLTLSVSRSMSRRKGHVPLALTPTPITPARARTLDGGLGVFEPSLDPDRAARSRASGLRLATGACPLRAAGGVVWDPSRGGWADIVDGREDRRPAVGRREGLHEESGTGRRIGRQRPDLLRQAVQPAMQGGRRGRKLITNHADPPAQLLDRDRVVPTSAGEPMHVTGEAANRRRHPGAISILITVGHHHSPLTSFSRSLRTPSRRSVGEHPHSGSILKQENRSLRCHLVTGS